MSLWPNVIRSVREGDRIIETLHEPSDEDLWDSIVTWEFRRPKVQMSEEAKADPKKVMSEYLAMVEHDRARAKKQFPRAWAWVVEKGLVK